MDTLVGKEEYVLPLVEASLLLSSQGYIGDTTVLNVTIENVSDAWFTVKNVSDYRFHDRADLLSIPPHHAVSFDVKTLERRTDISLSFDVLNVVTAPGVHPQVALRATIEQ